MVSQEIGPQGWRFCRFGLIVTGKGEAEFATSLFRALMATGRCTFAVIRRTNQRSPITSRARKLKMVGSGQAIPDKDQDEIGVPARQYLSGQSRRFPGGSAFVILLDDLEAERRDKAPDVFQRYRAALDKILHPDQRKRASVHFLVNMLEAYYFADASAVNEAICTNLEDYMGDVEEIRNPKGDLRKLRAGFDAVRDGKRIIQKLNVEHVLSRPQTCAWLRALFGWCSKAIGQPPTGTYQLSRGAYSIVTGPQIGDL